MNVLMQGPNFRSLAIRDLLEARDLYHFHLMNKANVVGTAIGLYLIRDKDDKAVPRTLSNSRVRPESWPCVLVFVREWLAADEFADGKKALPTDMVPKTLYMPDGRAVPVCTVKVEEVDSAERQRTESLPQAGLGGGLPLEVEVQGELHRASTGCLVTDGHLTYALTARHVCGPQGTPIYAHLREGRTRVGESSAKQLTRVPFSKAYQDFPGRRSFLAMDVGLVKVDNAADWTSNVYGLPQTGPLADVYEQNLTLQLIDQNVVAQGAVSALLRGTIKALFYRYRSVGGYDYVGDLLIAPVPSWHSAVPGDSGTIWHLDVTDVKDGEDLLKKPVGGLDLRPLAVLWGGQTFNVGGNPSNFTVATTLSNVCRMLDVELVTDQNRGVSGYWGRMGHYSIAAFAVQLVKDDKLRTLLQNNLERLSFDIETLREKDSTEILKNASFIPLADVADEVWKKYKTKPGGRDTKSLGKGKTTGPEHPNHYADIDFPYINGKSLRQLCLANPQAYFNPPAFQTYYQWLATEQPELGGGKTDPFKEGLLPFRIWQFFDELVSAAATDVVAFVAAAGLVAHYWGDACQPLHGSVYADGDPTRTKDFTHPVSGKTETLSYAEGVHSGYETAMIDRFRGALFDDIATQAKKLGGHGLQSYVTGQDAGLAAVKLMQDTWDTIKPMDICDAFEELGGTPSPRVAVLEGLFEQFGESTAKVMLLGARYLACFWDSAWAAGGGADAGHDLKELSTKALQDKYEDVDFVPSLTLSQIGEVLK